jgi:ornithine cyclodeaminase/alanine dehydrogenase-like protein (mu-crystallin family)
VSIRFVDGALVERYLTHELAFDSMRRLCELEAAGLAGGAGRVELGHAHGFTRVLPGVIDGLGVFGDKTISLVRSRSVRYAITMYSTESGAPIAIVDGEAIGRYRTGAGAAVAASVLCPEVDTAAMIGTGTVARHQLAATLRVRPVERVAVYSPSQAHRRSFIREVGPQVSAHLTEAASVEDALDGARLVMLATKSEAPIVEAVGDAIHVASLGAVRAHLHEIAPAAYAAFGAVVCDSVDLVFGHTGDGRAAAAAGYAPDRALSLAAAVAGSVHEPGAPTLYKSAGTGLQDLALAAAVLDRATADGVGVLTADPITPRPLD